MSRLLHLDTVDSTNTYLKTHRADLPHATVVYADKQTAGRGRLGRTWVSQDGGLYFSVLLKPPYTPFLPNLTQLMALSICRALEQYQLAPSVKWPNDVQINGQKISGILSEAVFDKTTFEALILGVGINICQTGLQYIDQPATSLKQVGVDVCREEVLQRVLSFFWQGYAPLCEKGFETIHPDYVKHMTALGKEITVKDGDKTICGYAEGVSPSGALLLRTALGLKEIYIGDVLS